jgi:hypothetical protein
MESDLTSLPKQDKFAFVSILTNQKNIIKANIREEIVDRQALESSDQNCHCSVMLGVRFALAE